MVVLLKTSMISLINKYRCMYVTSLGFANGIKCSTTHFIIVLLSVLQTIAYTNCYSSLKRFYLSTDQPTLLSFTSSTVTVREKYFSIMA